MTINQQNQPSTKTAAAAALYGKEGEYWLNQLSGPLEKTSFPSSYAAARPLQEKTGTVKIAWSNELVAKLTELSKGLDHRLYIILAAGLTVLLHKYTGSSGIIIGAPIFKQEKEGDFINTFLPLRNWVENRVSFRELLLHRVRQTFIAANEHQNYPMESLLFRLNIPIPASHESFPLFDVALLLENIHEKKYIQPARPNILFSFLRTNGKLEGEARYNPSLYNPTSVERIVGHFERLLTHAAFHINTAISDIDMLSREEKQQLLVDFNGSPRQYPAAKTITHLFQEQVARTPGNIALSSPLDLNDIYLELAPGSTTKNVNLDGHLLKKIAACCFKKCPYIYQSSPFIPGGSASTTSYTLLKTPQHDSLVVDSNVVKLLELFDGTHSAISIFNGINRLKNTHIKFIFYPVGLNDLLEVSHDFKSKPLVFSNNRFGDFFAVVKLLYRNHLIELMAVNSAQLPMDMPGNDYFSSDEPVESVEEGILLEELLKQQMRCSNIQVLLLGDTPGMATTGLLYLASYLKRHGIDAYCQFNDSTQDYSSMKTNIRDLLERIQPQLVAISLKWFLYIARVHDICKIVKEYAAQHHRHITVVVGGNTASYYWKEILNWEYVDYVIRGDGELPLLKICQGEEDKNIPNCVYKTNSKMVENPITYRQDETNSQEIYLSHLDDILLLPHAPMFGTFFIFTHKGCGMNCFYCGGCRQVQEKTFNRSKVFRRAVEQVRKDIIEAKTITSTFMFDFYFPNTNTHRSLLEYCQKIWEGIDLSNHFCMISNLTLPSAQLIRLATKTFKYVYWEIDICTLSQRLRNQLLSQKMIKPLPSDQELLAFLDACETHPNNEVRLNLITGLPYFKPEQDIRQGEKLLDKIMNTYTCFGELQWARLHAQPGAPIVENAQLHDMHGMYTNASGFEDFFNFSRKNFSGTGGTGSTGSSGSSDRSTYDGLESFYYPYIYFNDEELNSKVTQFYSKNNIKIEQHKKSKREFNVSENLTYEEFNQRSNQLARLLKAKGVKPDTLVGIMLEPCLDIPTAILAVLKAGGAYVPIDPDTPQRRIMSILNDCQASLLLTKRSVRGTSAANASAVSSTLPFSSSHHPYHLKPHVTAPRAQNTLLDRLPLPDRSLVDYDTYNKYIGHAMVKNYMSLQATRGCPYKCAYCHKIWPRRNVTRSAHHLFEEVQLYYNLGVRRFAFVDDLFNLDVKNSRRFFELIIQNRLNTQFFFPNGMRADLLTKDYIDLMVQAGLTSLGLALETASPRVQRLIGKHLNIEKLRENLHYICEKHPQIILELFTMHGFPTETQEEALQTLEFIKSIKWLHFPVVSILKIYPNTDMEKLALANGIPAEAIANSNQLAGHELPETLPFDKSFTLQYQADYLNSYFLSKERLLHVLPYQMKVLTEDEIVQKYNSYLPVDIYSFDDLLDFVGIRKDQLEAAGPVCFADEAETFVPHLNEKLKKCFPHKKPAKDALRVLLLDLSQFFSTHSNMLYNVVEAPLGLMYNAAYLHHIFGSKVNCKIAKSRFDFDNYEELKKIFDEFNPQVIGIRTLNFYKGFFHKTAAIIRLWGFDGPVISGGPYATSGYQTMLQDNHVDLVVLGEGEITFSQLIQEIMANGGKLPDTQVLKNIPGIAFMPTEERRQRQYTFETIMLDEQGELFDQLPQQNLEPLNQPTDIVYSIFTSGSSGKPKGVLLTHQNITNYIHWFSQTTHLSDQDKTLLTSSFAFDLGYTSLYPSLTTGGQLHIIPRNIYLSADKLLTYIKQMGITYMKLTPSLFSIIANNPDLLQAMYSKLRLVVLGGEPINTADVEQVHAGASEIEIMNHYGPTEAAIGVVARFIDFHRYEEYKEVPTIGSPIHNSRVYILDKRFTLLPVGVPGELCISGSCLARGYLNNPELTAEKFDHDLWDYNAWGPDKEKSPPNRVPAQRVCQRQKIYRTGDLARWQWDGNIEFLGRVDNQVKVRGYRIELEEIENLLLNHYPIETAAVIPRKDGDDETYLCAYIVPTASQQKMPVEPFGKLSGQGSRDTQPGQDVENVDIDHVNVVNVVSRFEQQVVKYADQIAVQSGQESLTYAELNHAASQLAQIISEKYDDRHHLSGQERKRYQRQMLLQGWGVEGQEKLKATTVFVAGAGGGASPTIMQLALAGVGTIIICDDDSVELSNLNRQFLHDESRLGMNKALSAQLTVNQVNPHVNVIPITLPLTAQNVFEIVGESAIIFDMFDGQAEKFILSECAAVKKIPHVISAMTDRSGCAALFHPPHTPCYHCIFDRHKYENLVDGMKQTFAAYQKQPLPVAATSLFLSSGFAVNEAIKILQGHANPAYNKYFFFNQAGCETLRYSIGFRAMTYTYSDHFRKICLEQGFDWEIGWRGKFLEEFDIVPDPDCPLCGAKGKERLASLQQEIEKQTKRSETVPVSAHLNPEHPEHPEHSEHLESHIQVKQTAALLMDDHNVYKPAAMLGILKAGKACIPLDNDTRIANELSHYLDRLEESGARIIITDKRYLQTAKKLRDQFHKGIPIINADEIEIEIGKGEAVSASSQEERLSIVRDHDHKEFPEIKANKPGPLMDPGLPAPLLRDNPPSPLKLHQQEKKNKEWLSQLKDGLSQVLPHYMVPSYFVQLEEMPLTPNGKIDKNALLVVEPKPGVEGDGYNKPTTEIEEKLAEIWSRVLGIEQSRINIDDNFFNLGGHSLKVTQMVSLLRSELNIKIPLAEIFRTPTIKGLGDYIATMEIETVKVRETPMVNGNVNDENVTPIKVGVSKRNNLFFIHEGSGEVDAYIELCNHLNADFNYWGIRADRLIDYTPSNLTIEEVAARYVEKIKKFQNHGPYFIVGWCIGGLIAFETVNQLEQMGEEIAFFAIIDSPPPQAKNSHREEKAVKKFSLQTELNWLLPHFSNEKITKKLKNITQIYQLWPLIIQDLEITGTDIEIIKKMIPGSMLPAIPNHEGSEIRELVYYVNMIRTYLRARTLYTPGSKLNTTIYYFAASQSNDINWEHWRQYTGKTVKYYQVQGDHFSILKKPGVEQFGRLFYYVLNKKT